MNVLSRAALAAALALTLTACSAGSEAPDADALTVSDAWAKSADSGMTAAFATLTNDADHDVVITGAHSVASARVELHEVANGSMREVDGGFTVPAHGSLTLEPGGLHLMFIDLGAPLVAGDEVTITVEFADGSARDLNAVVKDFAGANEDYDGGMDMAGASARPSMDG